MNQFSKLLCSTLFGLSLIGTVACGGREPDGSTPPAPCGSCASYEMCTPANTCGINPNTSWFFAAVDARIAPTKANGADWDAGGGAPDPFVLIDGAKTKTIDDTFTPAWNQGVSYTAASLLQQGVTVQILDEDVSQHDIIAGPNLVRPTESDLRRGSLTLMNFGQAQNFSIALLPR